MASQRLTIPDNNTRTPAKRTAREPITDNDNDALAKRLVREYTTKGESMTRTDELRLIVTLMQQKATRLTWEHARARANTSLRQGNGQRGATTPPTPRANSTPVNANPSQNRYTLLDPDVTGTCNEMPETATTHGWTVVTHKRKPTTTSRMRNAGVEKQRVVANEVEAHVNESTCGDVQAQVEAHAGVPACGDAHPPLIPSPDPGVTPLTRRLDAQSDDLGTARVRSSRMLQLREATNVELTSYGLSARDTDKAPRGDNEESDDKANTVDRNGLDKHTPGLQGRSSRILEMRRRVHEATLTIAEILQAEETRPPVFPPVGPDYDSAEDDDDDHGKGVRRRLGTGMLSDIDHNPNPREDSTCTGTMVPSETLIGAKELDVNGDSPNPERNSVAQLATATHKKRDQTRSTIDPVCRAEHYCETLGSLTDEEKHDAISRCLMEGRWTGDDKEDVPVEPTSRTLTVAGTGAVYSGQTEKLEPLRQGDADLKPHDAMLERRTERRRNFLIATGRTTEDNVSHNSEKSSNGRDETTTPSEDTIYQTTKATDANCERPNERQPAPPDDSGDNDPIAAIDALTDEQRGKLREVLSESDVPLTKTNLWDILTQVRGHQYDNPGKPKSRGEKTNPMTIPPTSRTDQIRSLTDMSGENNRVMTETPTDDGYLMPGDTLNDEELWDAFTRDDREAMLSRFLGDSDVDDNSPEESDTWYGSACETRKLEDPDGMEDTLSDSYSGLAYWAYKSEDEDGEPFYNEEYYDDKDEYSVPPSGEDDDEHGGHRVEENDGEGSVPYHPATTDTEEKIADTAAIDGRPGKSNVTDLPTGAYDNTTLDHHTPVTRTATTRTCAPSSAQSSTDEPEGGDSDLATTGGALLSEEYNEDEESA
ncbi:hypothetical protein EDB83DRAFT_2531789 [Lactarius deliciosus]|nr:hypothetical protein EDB83DRAFT_2531789 [Lactarius deliciosus]